MADLVGLGLAGGPARGEAGSSGPATRPGPNQRQQFLRRLNSYGISRREFARPWKSWSHKARASASKILTRGSGYGQRQSLFNQC